MLRSDAHKLLLFSYLRERKNIYKLMDYFTLLLCFFEV